MKRNLAKQSIERNAAGKVTSGFATGATPADVSSLEGDINDDTDFGAKAHADVLKKQQEYETGVAYEQPEALKMRNEDTARKMGLAMAPNAQLGANGVAEQEVKNRGALDLLREKQHGESELYKMFSGGGDANGPSAPPTMSIGPSGVSLHQPTMNPGLQKMSMAANDILDMLDSQNYEGQAKDLQQKGLFTPGIGGARRFLAQHGMGTLAGVDDATAKQMGKFESDHDLMMTQIANAITGARGAGSSAIANRFDKILSTAGDLPTFYGQLEAVRSMLEGMARHTNKRRGGMAPGAGTEDLGADF
jgi:hypothetical protein